MPDEWTVLKILDFLKDVTVIHIVTDQSLNYSLSMWKDYKLSTRI